MTSMKISMVTPIYPPHLGGIEIITQSLVHELRERGNEVNVYHPANMDVEKNNLPVIKHIINFFRALRFLKTIHCDDADIIHVQQTEPSLLYPIILKWLYPKKTVIVHCHTLMIIDSGKDYCRFNFSIKGIARYFFMVLPAGYLERNAIRSADHVIAVTDEVAQICTKFRHSGVSLILNGIPLDEFPIRATVSTGRPDKILCPGRLTLEKGWIYFVEALPTIITEIDVCVIFSGGDAEGYKSILIKRAEELGVSGKITFLEGVDFQTLIKYQSECDIVVLPWLAESFGLSVFENLAMGNIIVSTNVGGISGFIRDKEAGLLVEPANPAQLASAIIEGLTNNELRGRIHKNAPEKAKEYDIKRTVDQIETLYRDCS